MYTRTFLEVFGADKSACNAVMEGVRALQAQAAGLGLDAAPTPHSCYTMSPELVSASSAAGLESGYLSFHSEESDEEEQMMQFGSGPMWDNRVANGIPTPPVTGTTSLEYFLDRLRAAGLEEPVRGHVLLVHECCLTAEGAALARERLAQPFLAVCPLSNLFIHNLLPPIPVMRASGIPICVGTDSLSSNDQLNMVAELYTWWQSSIPCRRPSRRSRLGNCSGGPASTAPVSWAGRPCWAVSKRGKSLVWCSLLLVILSEAKNLLALPPNPNPYAYDA